MLRTRLACQLTIVIALLLSALCQAQSFDTPSGSLTLDHGVIVAAHNSLTGETYVAGKPSDSPSSIVRPGAPSPNPDDSLTTTVAPSPTGDFTVRQSAQSSAPGVYGCQWGIAGIADDAFSLIVPAWSGVQLRRGSPFTEGVFDWPTSWEAQMIIIQGPKGGLWIYADDPDDRFKGVWIRHRKGAFDLGFRTYNEGSPAEHKSIESVTWRVGFYRGDWRVPARQYRDWMARTAHATPLAKRTPSWVDGIRSVVILGTSRDPKALAESRAILTKLAETVTPSKTLLYTPGWRRSGYDLNYPDYTAHDGYPELVAFAHNLGYRVMPHTCYYGASLDNPDYQALKPYHMRDQFTGDLITYEWKWADPVPHISFLHPGAKAWRDLYVRKCREIQQNYHADAVHLDCTLVMPNVLDRADGLNTIQGNQAFHRDLRTALPDLALGGEGLNEVSCRHEAFAQIHAAFAILFAGGTPERAGNDPGADCSHPISAYLLSPYTRWYGYLGYPPPDDSPLYRTWTRAYESWGVAPTLASPTLAGLEHPNPDLRVRLEEMKLVDHYALQPDFDSEAPPTTKLVWRGKGGAKLVYDRDDHGGSHVWFADASGKPRTIYRYLRGATTFLGEGTIGQAAAYDERGIYGLDPTRTYLCTPGPRPADVPHLLRLPEGMIATGLRSSADFLLFDLAAPRPGIDLRQTFADATLGITVDGRDHPLGSQAVFTQSRDISGGKLKDSLFSHPPWDYEHGVIGEAFAEWTIAVPRNGRPALDFFFGLRDGAEKGDGVTFSVRVDGKELMRRDWQKCEWLPCRLDLAPYAGRTIKLRFAVTKGPVGKGAFAWSCWGEPRIVVDPTPQPLSLELLAPGKAVSAYGTSGPAHVDFLRAEGKLFRHRVDTQAPGATCLLFRKPEAATLPVDLLTAPFTWGSVVAGAEIPPQERPAYLSATPGEGTCGGASRPSLVTHPPIGGTTAIDYLLTLPAGKPARLSFACGLQDGSKSTNGVAFIVAVNGQEASRQVVAAADGWHPGEVDLTPYAGETVLLSLVVDSLGDASYDWSRWSQPRIETR